MIHSLKIMFWLSVSSTVTLLAISTVFLLPFVDGKKCPGKCMSNATICKLEGGRVAGYCTNEQACCDFAYKKTGSCGAKMVKLTTAIFQSPDYPHFSKGDLNCQFQFAIDGTATGLIVEFTDAFMDGAGFIKHSSCESDMIYLKGFPDWTPPAHCGNLTNYAAVIDLDTHLTKGMKELTVLAIMSSRKYKWNIKVSQVFGNSTNTEDEGEADDDIPEIPRTNSLNEFREGFDEESGESVQEQLDSIMSILNEDPSDIDENYDEYESDDYSESMVVNGDDGMISDIPWQASLRVTISAKLIPHLTTLKLKNCTIDEGVHFCGGSIISDHHILSATHCFLLGDKLRTWQSLSSVKVVLGDSNLCDEEKTGVQEMKVDKVYFHYGYDNRAILNDIVVIKVKEKIVFNDKVQSIAMAKPGMSFQHQLATISGWGLTNLTASSTKGSKKRAADQLQYADNLFIGNRTHCAKEQLKLFPRVSVKELTKYPKYSDTFNSLLCTYVRNGTKEAGMVGQGDSGGPLTVKQMDAKKNSSSPLLIGVTSYMVPIPVLNKPHDVSKYVDFYQSVAFYRKWIDLAMQ